MKRRLPKNRPEEIVESLHITAGQTIADIGSGGGHFTFEFARKVGQKVVLFGIGLITYLTLNTLMKKTKILDEPGR